MKILKLIPILVLILSLFWLFSASTSHTYSDSPGIHHDSNVITVRTVNDLERAYQLFNTSKNTVNTENFRD